MFSKTSKIALATVFALLALSAPAHSAFKLIPNMNQINDMTVKDDKPATVIELSADLVKEVGNIDVKIQPYQGTVAFYIPNCYVDPPKKFFNSVQSDVVTKVSIFQLNPKMVVATVWLNKAYKAEAGRIKTETKDGKILLQLWKIQPPVTAATLGTAAVEAKKEEAPAVPAQGQESVELLDPPIDLSKIFAEASSDKKQDAQKGAPADPAKIAEAKPDVGAQVPSLTGSVVKMVSALFGVLGAMALLVAGYRRYGKGAIVFKPAFQKPVRVISSVALGPKKQVSIIDVAGEILAVGVSENQISLLAKIDNPAVTERLLGTKTEIDRGADGAGRKIAAEIAKETEQQFETKPDNVFLAEFTREIGKYREAANGSAPANGAAGPDTLKSIRDRLATMRRL
jgi:flagellar biogenesis protein FliO